MYLSNLTFVVTEDCNFRCSYCYQEKTKDYIDAAIIEKAVDFFFPFLSEECFINFYGGEPLLAVDQIRDGVDYIENKKKREKKYIQYSITTNGSLLDEQILSFLNKNKFSVLLSFDGLAQEITKKKASSKPIVSNIKRLLELPHIDLETNSVFTQKTVVYLSKSVRLFIDLGIPNISFALSRIFPWERSSLVQLRKELSNVRQILLSNYKKTSTIPLVDFRRNQKRGIFVCFAGRDRMTLTPEGKLWGCDLFADYFKGKAGMSEYDKYCFGDLDSFVDRFERVYPEILSNHSKLRMDRFFTSNTSCLKCNDLEICKVCPVDNMFSDTDIRKVSSWSCEMKRILIREKELFWEGLKAVF